MPKKYLASTSVGIDAFCQEELLLLGGWCLEAVQDTVGNCYQDERICPPYGFSIEERQHSQELLLDFYPIVLEEITRALNSYHNISRSTRYWEIALGSWLYRLVSLILNRYLHLEKTFKQNPKLRSHICLPFDACTLAGDEELDSVELIKKPSWNSMLYGYLVEKYFPSVNNIFWQVKGVKEEKKNLKRVKPKNKLKSIFSEKYFYRNAQKLFVYKSYLSFFDDLILRVRIGQFPVLSKFRRSIRTNEYDAVGRSNLLAETGENKKLNVIRNVVPLLLPKVFFEAYKVNIKFVDRTGWPIDPEVIYTANGFAGDSVFQLWLAEKTFSSGAVYIAGQHGANYGTLKLSVLWPEMRTSDQFISWGWSNEGRYYGNVLRGYNLIGRKLSHRPLKKTALIITKGPGNRSSLSCRHFEYMKEINTAKSTAFIFKGFVDWSITLRMHHGAGDTERQHYAQFFQDKGIRGAVDDGSTALKKVSKKIGLMVFTYDSAGLLEALQNNVPCVAVFEDWPGRLFPQAQSDYDQLRDAQIIHNDVASLNTFLTMSIETIFEWWNSEGVQAARRCFVQKYSSDFADGQLALAMIIKRTGRR